MTSGVTSLPDELLAAILSHISKSDLKNARSTCLRWSNIGAEFLFQRVYFAPRKGEMELFSNITSHPIFSRTIKEVVYDGRLFVSPYSDRQRFLDQYQSWIDATCPDMRFDMVDEELVVEHWGPDDSGSLTWIPSSVPDLVKAIYSSYLELLSEQEDILANGRDFELLCSGFKEMPLITTLTIMDHFNFPVYQDWLPFDEREHSKYFVGTTIMPQPTTWFEQPGYPDTQTWEVVDLPDWDVRGIDHLFSALLRCSTLVNRLRLGDPTSNFPMQIFTSGTPAFKFLQDIASTLVEFRIDCQPRSWAPKLPALNEQLSGVSSVITQARHLDVLSLSLLQESDINSINFGSIQLKALSLANISLTSDDFLTLVTSSKTTLKRMQLRNLVLSDDTTWQNLADQCGQLLKLQFVSLLRVGSDEWFFNEEIPPYLSDEALRDVARRMLGWANPGSLLESSMKMPDDFNAPLYIPASQRLTIWIVDTERSQVPEQHTAVASG